MSADTLPLWLITFCTSGIMTCATNKRFLSCAAAAATEACTQTTPLPAAARPQPPRRRLACLLAVVHRDLHDRLLHGHHRPHHAARGLHLLQQLEGRGASGVGQRALHKRRRDLRGRTAGRGSPTPLSASRQLSLTRAGRAWWRRQCHGSVGRPRLVEHRSLSLEPPGMRVPCLGRIAAPRQSEGKSARQGRCRPSRRQASVRAADLCEVVEDGRRRVVGAGEPHAVPYVVVVGVAQHRAQVRYDLMHHVVQVLRPREPQQRPPRTLGRQPPRSARAVAQPEPAPPRRP
jgi:hypothetical protein